MGHVPPDHDKTTVPSGSPAKWLRTGLDGAACGRLSRARGSITAISPSSQSSLGSGSGSGPGPGPGQ